MAKWKLTHVFPELLKKNSAQYYYHEYVQNMLVQQSKLRNVPFDP